jgi:hypothetical protein
MNGFISDRKKSFYIGLLSVLAAALIIVATQTPLLALTKEFLSEGDVGLLGFLVYASIMVLWSILCLPQTPIEAMSAVIWPDNIVKAVAAAWGSKMIAGSTCFCIAYFGSSFVSLGRVQPEGLAPPTYGTAAAAPTPNVRQTTRQKIAKYLLALESVINIKPHTTTFLISCAYLPAFMKNYGIGILSSRHIDGVGFRHFFLWSALTGVCFSAANVTVAATAIKIAQTSHQDSGETTQNDKTQLYMFLAATVFTLGGIIALGRYTTKYLNEQLALSESAQAVVNGGVPATSAPPTLGGSEVVEETEEAAGKKRKEKRSTKRNGEISPTDSFAEDIHVTEISTGDSHLEEGRGHLAAPQ